MAEEVMDAPAPTAAPAAQSAVPSSPASPTAQAPAAPDSMLPAWQDVRQEWMAQFPALSEDRVKGTYEGIAHLANWNARLANAEETTGSWLYRRALPVASAQLNIRNAGYVDQARQKILNGTGTAEDAEVIAVQNRLAEADANQTTGQRIGSGIASLPAVVGEAYLGGRILRPIMGLFAGAAAAEGGAAAIPGTVAAGNVAQGALSRFAQGAVTAPLMPSLYAERAISNNREAGRNANDWRGYPAAITLAAVQNGVFSSVQNLGGSAPMGPGALDTSRRLFAQTVGAMALQQGMDIGTSAIDDTAKELFGISWNLNTRYGIIGSLYRGERGEALQDSLVQAATMLAFAGLHESSNRPRPGADIRDWQMPQGPEGGPLPYNPDIILRRPGEATGGALTRTGGPERPPGGPGVVREGMNATREFLDQMSGQRRTPEEAAAELNRVMGTVQDIVTRGREAGMTKEQARQKVIDTFPEGQTRDYGLRVVDLVPFAESAPPAAPRPAGAVIQQAAARYNAVETNRTQVDAQLKGMSPANPRYRPLMETSRRLFAESQASRQQLAQAMRQAAPEARQGVQTAEAAPRASEPVQTPPASPERAPAGATFTTARGSTYTVNENGTTTRNAVAQQGTSAGQQRPSERTIYVSNEVAGKLTGGGIVIEGNQAGKGRMNAKGEFVAKERVPFSETPAVGMAPVELYRSKNGGYQESHVGSPITAMEGPKGAKAAAVAEAVSRPAEAPQSPPEAGRLFDQGEKIRNVPRPGGPVRPAGLADAPVRAMREQTLARVDAEPRPARAPTMRDRVGPLVGSKVNLERLLDATRPFKDFPVKVIDANQFKAEMNNLRAELGNRIYEELNRQINKNLAGLKDLPPKATGTPKDSQDKARRAEVEAARVHNQERLAGLRQTLREAIKAGMSGKVDTPGEYRNRLQTIGRYEEAKGIPWTAWVVDGIKKLYGAPPLRGEVVGENGQRVFQAGETNVDEKIFNALKEGKYNGAQLETVLRSIGADPHIGTMDQAQFREVLEHLPERTSRITDIPERTMDKITTHIGKYDPLDMRAASRETLDQVLQGFQKRGLNLAHEDLAGFEKEDIVGIAASLASLSRQMSKFNASERWAAQHKLDREMQFLEMAKGPQRTQAMYDRIVQDMRLTPKRDRSINAIDWAAPIFEGKPKSEILEAARQLQINPRANTKLPGEMEDYLRNHFDMTSAARAGRFGYQLQDVVRMEKYYEAEKQRLADERQGMEARSQRFRDGLRLGEEAGRAETLEGEDAGAIAAERNAPSVGDFNPAELERTTVTRSTGPGAESASGPRSETRPRVAPQPQINRPRPFTDPPQKIADFLKEFHGDESGHLDMDVLRDLAEDYGVDPARNAIHHLNTVWRQFAGEGSPKTTDMNAATGEALERFNGSEIYARFAAPVLAEKVLGNNDTPQFRSLLGGVLTERRFRYMKKVFGDLANAASVDLQGAISDREAAQAGERDAKQQAAEHRRNGMPRAAETADAYARTFAKARAEADAKARDASARSAEYIKSRNDVPSIIGKPNSPFKTFDDYRAAALDPLVVEGIRRHEKYVVPVMSDAFRRSQGMEPDDPINNITQIPGSPVNLKSAKSGDKDVETVIWTRGEGAAGEQGPPGGQRAGRPANAKLRKNKFANQATGTSEGYDIDYGKIVENSLVHQLTNAAKAEAVRKGVEAGIYQWGKPGQRVAFEGEQARWGTEFSDVKPPKGTQEAANGQTSLYVHPNAAHEFRRAIEIDEPLKFQTLEKFMGAIMAVNLASTAELTYHLKNQLGFLLRTGLHPVQLFQDAAAIIRRDPKIMDELVELARINTMKSEGFETNNIVNKGKWNPLRWGGKLLDLTRKVLLLQGNRAYDRMVKAGLTKGSETGRRNFLNQLGNYNKRSQHKLIKFLRESSIGPFATAGFNYLVQGVRSVVMNPGTKAASFEAMLRLRAAMLLRTVAVLAAVELLNKALWGRLDASDDTPLGAFRVGDSPFAPGRSFYVDVMDMIGLKRGLRVMGLLALIEGKRKNAPPEKIADKAARDVTTALVHPLAGPGAQFGLTAGWGVDASGFHVAEHASAMRHESQAWLNFRAALEHANPAYATAFGHEQKQKPAGQRAMELLGPFGVRTAPPPQRLR